ncbi:MAG: class I SAM-dependent methyltransferase [Acidobacteriota bacterium]
MSRDGVVPGSFRDPNGFVFRRGGRLYRQVNQRYREEYDRLMQSGLYGELARDRFLIPHVEVEIERAASDDAYRVLQPQELAFISYPYEWCFGQLKRAALLTLDIQARALNFGMSLKDASAYNIQFANGEPVLIDSLSFEIYKEGQPWVAYRQFCQHFLAPLALMALADIRLQQLNRVYLDGIPLDLASRLLPLHSRANLGLLAHLFLHAQAQKHMGTPPRARQGTMARTSLLGLVDSLKSTIQKLEWVPQGTEWHDYYATSSYTTAGLQAKMQVVAEMLSQVTPAPKMVWDLGANTGRFSRIVSERGIQTIALDGDPAAVEKNFRNVVAHREQNLLPLCLDLTNPSPAAGWENQERMSLCERGPADVVLALALIHHLAIGNNLPFARIAGFFSRIGRSLILEFVPKDDPQVQRLLANREDIFDRYRQDDLERDFGEQFQILRQEKIADMNRTVYLMVRR